jgi:hypothetical protein
MAEESGGPERTTTRLRECHRESCIVQQTIPPYRDLLHLQGQVPDINLLAWVIPNHPSTGRSTPAPTPSVQLRSQDINMSLRDRRHAR